jgi:hypothetical protein
MLCTLTAVSFLFLENISGMYGEKQPLKALYCQKVPQNFHEEELICFLNFYYKKYNFAKLLAFLPICFLPIVTTSFLNISFFFSFLLE